MRGRTHRLKQSVLAVLVALDLLGASTQVAQAAGSAAVVQRLARHGRMSKRKAKRLVRAVSEKMAANARRGGDEYDTLRQAIGERLYPDGAGDTREEYESRLNQVRLKLYEGLNEWALNTLFGVRADAVEDCERMFELSGRTCVSLVAAAEQRPFKVVRKELRDGSSDELLQRARAALRMGQYEVAAEAYEKLAHRRPDDPVALAGLGHARLRADDVQGAVRAFEAAVKAAPQHANLRANLGHARLTAGQAKQARASFRQALKLNPQHASAKRGLEQARPEREAPSQPKERHADARQRAETQRPPHEQKTAKPSTEPQAPQRARATEDTPSANARRLWQLAEAPHGGSRSEAIRAQARQHFLAQRHAQALQAYQRAAVEDPSNAAAFAGIGASKLALGRASAAADAYQTAVRLSPRAARLHAALGHAYLAAGQSESAEAAFRRALSLRSGLSAARAGLRELEEGGHSVGSTEATSSKVVLASAEGPAPTPPWRKAGSKGPELPTEWNFSKKRSSASDEKASSAHATASGSRPAKNTQDDAAQAASQSTRSTPPSSPPSKPSQRDADGAQAASEESTAGKAGGPLDNSLLSSLMADPNGASSSDSENAAAAAADLRKETLGTATPSPDDMAEGKGKGPSRKEILGIMKPLKDLVRQCAPEHEGIVKVDLTVRGRDGAVTKAEVQGALAEGMEATCISEVMRTASFPKFSKETLTITFPYKL